jgi:type I restriction enzyme, S subunit
VTSDRLDALRVPVPPLPEQRQIAEVLDWAEALRDRRRSALTLVDALANSVFLDLFGDPETNPKGWERVCLGDIVATGPQNGLYKPSTDYGSGTPIVRIDAFYDGVITKLGSLKRVRASDAERISYGLLCGDILVNRVNSPEYLGKSAIVPPLDEPVVFESNMMRLRVDTMRACPTFVVHFLQTGFIKQQIARCAKDAVNQSSINQNDVKEFQVNLPPLSLQQEFAVRMDAVGKLKATHRASLLELDALFASLQHRAFRGEL